MPEHDVNADEPAVEPQRFICWPDFDMTCVEGGCVYCVPGSEDEEGGAKPKTRRQILSKARSRGMDVLFVQQRLAMPAERLVRT